MSAQSASIGKIVLFGSGETLPSSGKTHEAVARQLEDTPRIAILETPAGFEPNSDKVAGRIATFLKKRLQNYAPKISVLPARKRGTPFSPDEYDVVQPILKSNWILLGPGSPTYGARQLRESLAVEMIAARHRMGHVLMLSSSSTLAFSTYTMPVYEIYKVGEDLHWKRGVDYFSQLGVPLVIIPHWDNSDGGADLDTSRCYMGRDRFNQLRTMLPTGMTILGIDEHTSLTIDIAANCCTVIGNGRVYLVRDGQSDLDPESYKAGDSFAADRIGPWQVPTNGSGLDRAIWEAALAPPEPPPAIPQPPPEVFDLVQARAAARAEKRWKRADELRDEIANFGWQVKDTPEGPSVEPLA